MVNETAMRRALDPQFIQVLKELNLPITWSLGDGDSWPNVAAQLAPGDWLVVTYLTGEVADWEEELADLLHWCPYPILLMPDKTGGPMQGVVALYDLTPASERALNYAALLTSTLEVPLNVVGLTGAHEMDDVVELLKTILAKHPTDYQLQLLPNAGMTDVIEYAGDLKPALIVTGVKGAGMGIATPFGRAELDADLKSLVTRAPYPVLCLPEWGESWDEGLPMFSTQEPS